MSFSAVRTTMLYCPKCQQTYEDGAQRFCLNDGGRLLPVQSSDESAANTGGVFSNVLNRKSSEENDEFASAPRFSQMAFRPPSGKIFKSEFEPENAQAEIEPENVRAETVETETPDVLDLEVESASFVSENEIERFDDDDLELELEPLTVNAPLPPDDETLLEIGLEPETTALPPTEPEAEIENAETEIAPEIEIAEIENAEAEIETKVENAETETEPEIENAETEVETESETVAESPEIKSAPRIVNPDEIIAGQAALGDRKINPAGRTAISWENQHALIGQTIKGRYLIVEQFGAEIGALDFLAEDKINPDKKVVVRVLMDEDSADSFAGKIFDEERITLSHINHPNVVRVIDSGELSEGKPFVITEYVKGESVKSRLERKGKFDPLRTVRIIRQASYALSEVHQSGILHRDLKPENIILTVSEIGAEQIKLTNFGALKIRLNESNLPYKSPEQVEGKLANAASDEFSLAVIAYQMLTNQLPFNADKIGSLLKQQREGLIVETATLNDEVPPPVDEILAKALSFNPADRYLKTRDFGDALYAAVTAEKSLAESLPVEEEPTITTNAPADSKARKNVVLTANVRDSIIAEQLPETAAEKIKAAKDSSLKKRPSETPAQNGGNRMLFAVLGAAMLVAAVAAIWLYRSASPNEVKPVAPPPTVEPSVQTIEKPTVVNTAPTAPENIETPPSPRTVSQPPNTIYFENSKDALSDEAAKNFLGFSLYYPQSWKLKEAKNNFLDVSKTDEKNLPVEQMLVSYYDSEGTFKADRDLFPKLLEKSNSDLKKALGDYQIISQGETNIQNNRWQAFEVKFESAGTAPNGEKITLWGRRLWIPAQLVGAKNGYVITMLATSLSPDVKSVEDVGVKGDLSGILETFEPKP